MKLPVIVLITYLIAFVVITGVAYFILERRRIKKALEDPAAARHSNLPAPDTTARTVAFIVIFFMFWSFSNSINNLSNDLSKEISNGANTIAENNADNIESALNKQQSFLAYIYVEYVDDNKVSITIIPKEVNESTTVSVYFDDDRHITLTRGEGGQFKGTFEREAGIDYNWEVYLVSVETDGVIYSQMVDSNNIVY